MPAAPARESNLAATPECGSFAHSAERTRTAAGTGIARCARQHHRLARVALLAGGYLCCGYLTAVLAGYLEHLTVPVFLVAAACVRLFFRRTSVRAELRLLLPEVPARRVAANSSAALLAVDRGACRPGSATASGVTRPTRQVTY